METELPRHIAHPDPSLYFSDNYVVVDFETDTSHGDYGHPVHPDNQLLLACWRVGPGHEWWTVDDDGHPLNDITFARFGNELDQGPLAEAIATADFVVAHNAKYELGWFIRMGIDISRVLVFDTKLGEYVLLGNLSAGSKDLGMWPRSTSLDMCCRRRGLPVKDPVVDTMIGHGINPILIPRPWLEGRCRQDVETTEKVFLSQREELQRRGQLAVLYTRCLLTPVLAEIEQEGMAIDIGPVKTEYEKYARKSVELNQQFAELTGGINMNSAPQMAHFIYGKPEAGGLGFEEMKRKNGEAIRNAPTKQFPNGQPQTDLKTLDKLVPRTKRQKEFIALRKELGKVEAMLSKNLEFFRGVAEEHGGVFFGEISQTSTATHRTASNGVPLVFQNQLDDSGKPITRRVQFQNFPRVLKKLFKAKRPGWLMAEPDGSQIEFRCAAVLGNDKQAIADIVNPDFDAHIQTASVMHNMTAEQVKQEKKEAQAAGRDDLRQLAKPDTYKPLYGGKYGTPEQERYYKWFREHYGGISKAQDGWVNEALETKRQRTPWGLTYYWPTARRRGGSVNVETAVCNYPVQALATAEIIPVAVVYLWHRIRQQGLQDKIKIVNMVHDSAPSEVHPDAVEQFRALVKQSFTHDVYRYLETVYGMKFDQVPLGYGLKFGEHWGDGTEEAYDVYSSGKEVKRK